MNQVLLNGKLAQDPQVRIVNDKMTVANFGLAVSTKSKDKDKSVIFINCTCWNNTAKQVAQQFVKGSYVALIGHLNVESYTDKNGNKVVKTGVVVDEIFNATLLPREDKPAPVKQEQSQPQEADYVF